MTKQTVDEREREFNREVGVRIRKVREEAGIKVAELAAAVGVSRQSLYMWEKGETGVTPMNLGLVANALCVRADDLVPTLTPSMRPRPLVRVEVRTRHPEDYELVNYADGTRWEIRDGSWKRSTRPIPPDEQVEAEQDG